MQSGNLRLRTVGWECFLQKHGIDVKVASTFQKKKHSQPTFVNVKRKCNGLCVLLSDIFFQTPHNHTQWYMN